MTMQDGGTRAAHGGIDFDGALNPRAVAVYGASERASTQGSRIVARLVDGAFDGRVIPIGRTGGLASGIRIERSATSGPLAGSADFAVFCVPAAGLGEAIDDAIAAGITVGTVISAGFAEIGGDGEALQKITFERARANGLRLFGPNCLGLIDFSSGLRAATPPFSEPTYGPVAIVSQSGAVGSRMMSLLDDAELGVDLWLTIGNCADIGAADCVEYLVTRDSTQIIFLYLENFDCADRMRAAFANARSAGKEIVLVKAGYSPRGAQTSASHTASAASPDVLIDALVAGTDVVRADSIAEGALICALLDSVGRMRGRLAIVSPAGGECVLAADASSAEGLELAKLSDKTVSRLLEVVPQAGVTNPVDPTTFAVANGHLGTLIEIVDQDPDVSSIVYLDGGVMGNPHYARLVCDALQTVGSETQVILDARVHADTRAELRARGFAVTDAREQIWRAIKKISVPSPDRTIDTEPRTDAATEQRSSIAAPSAAFRSLGDDEAIAVFVAAGVPMVRTLVVSTEDEVSAALDRLGPRVVLKGVLPAVTHKSEHQLVHTDIRDRDDAVRIWRRLHEQIGATPGARVIIQPQADGGIAELALGVVNDPAFGLHVMLCRGGLWTDIETVRAWHRGVPTVDESLRMIASIPIGQAILGSVRPGLSTDCARLAETIRALAAWAADEGPGLADCEINPLIVTAGGHVGVDAVIRYRTSADSTEREQ